MPEKYLPKPERPLKVLTLEGDGLQGVAQLVILKALLAKIAEKRGEPGISLRPCDVFGVICGIGGGGCLALLLGRFHLSTDRALCEWRKFAPTCKKENEHPSVLINNWEFEDAVRRREEQYKTGRKLMDSGAEQTSCRHVFVAARADTIDPRWIIYRAYDALKIEGALADPLEPNECQLLSAFVGTIATKYFSDPREMTDSTNTTTNLLNDFPNQLNIDQIAAHEIWALYGVENVKDSIFANIGPGPPHHSEVRKIMGVKHSWSSIPSTNLDRQVYPINNVKQFHPVLEKSVRGAVFGEEDILRKVSDETKVWLQKHKVADTIEQCAQEIVSLDSQLLNALQPSTSGMPPPPYD
ncbi:hypothetical protein HYALB_00012628 [Hymenoscyphus albidus]|uniref:PNPLA domain-containing protein n=1 Tax=Hymenoscyphus albidus TaxID=595503 RepID=A0A9N9QB45_9HELO|nr:hypothetical protein HYALB_00012628 [Hymenoscyphus albidus]